MCCGAQLRCIPVQLLAFRRPELVAGLVLVDPVHEQMTAALPAPLRWGMRLAASSPPGRHLVVDRAGHDIPGDRPGAVADAILEGVAQARTRDG